MTILAGDIGGTKTVLALIDPQVGFRQPLAEARFVSRDYDSLSAIVDSFLAACRPTIERSSLAAAAFGIAGPIEKGTARVTNLPWLVRQTELAQSIGLDQDRVLLLNDLEATAAALPYLQPDDLQTVKAGSPVPRAPRAIIAPGTGLGVAYSVWIHGQYHPFPSEGGHRDFAPANQLERKLLDYLAEKYGHVSVERVCSGMGLPNIYRFLRDVQGMEEPVALTEALSRTDDITPVIVANALDPNRSIPLTRQTLELFVSILAAEAGNLALAMLAIGGIYLGGGIPPRILNVLKGDRFREAFINKGRMSELLTGVPVYVMTNEKTPLLGAGYAAAALL